MKKVATLMGIAIVSLGILAGCGGDKPSASNNTSTSLNQNSSQPSASSNNTSAATGSAKEVKVLGTNYKFEVTQGEIKAGDKVKLVFQTKEGVHGYAIKNTSVKADAVTGEKTVEWSPDKPGEYDIYCSTMCGSGHSDMHAKIVVK